MKNIKLFFYLTILTNLLFTSCSKEEEELHEFTGDVSVTLINKGNSETVEGEETQFVYDVILSKSFDKQITLNFDLSNKDKYPNLFSKITPVIIRKNQTKGLLKISTIKKSNFEISLKNDATFNILLKDFKGVKNNIKLNNKYILKIKKNEDVVPLTEKQKGLLEHYKKQGLDLTKWIGKIPVSVKVVTASGGYISFGKSETKNYKGFTYITLSENATEDKPLLVMTKNAFGLSDYLQDVFRRETVLDTAIWRKQPSPIQVLKALGNDVVKKWENKELKFDVKVDDIEVKTDGSIIFVRENGTYDTYTNFLDPNKTKAASAVNFQYEAEIWDIFAKIAKNNTELQTFMTTGGSVHPNNYIPYSTILKDDWDVKNYVKPEGKIENSKMIFKFNSDHTNSGDYDIISVTYESIK